jgi:sodium-dependent phosphate transporter
MSSAPLMRTVAHGANDVSNAIGPYAAIYYVWSNGVVTPSNSPTPTWMLAFGGAMIVIGLATYGYNIMAVIGNRLTMHSPSRGFSMEFGAAITVLLASQYAIPVSTTMCICGSTAGVGIVSSGFKGLNYRAFGWIIVSRPLFRFPPSISPAYPSPSFLPPLSLVS